MFQWVTRLFQLISHLPILLKIKLVHVSVVEITNVQHRMLGVVFEGYVVNKYGYYNVVGSGFKYIHYDLIDPFGYLTIMLTVRFAFVTIFSPRLNFRSYVWIVNFNVTFRNKFERAIKNLYWVGAITMIEYIDAFRLCLRFIPMHKQSFMQRDDLEVFGTI